MRPAAFLSVASLLPGTALPAAEALLASLTAEPRWQVVVEFTSGNADCWSSLPCGLTRRSAPLLSSLTTTPATAAAVSIRRGSQPDIFQ